MSEELNFNGKLINEINYLFFDNEKYHLEETNKLCPNITCVEVHDFPSLPEKDYCRYFEGAYSGNSYTRHVTESKAPTGQGLSIDDINKIISWANTKIDHPRDMKVFFDWDRTLSCVEGFLAPSYGPTKFDAYGIKVDDIISYLMYSPIRRAKLVEMYNTIIRNDIAMYIITNNTTCINYKEIFHELVSALFTGFNIDNILCSLSHMDKGRFFCSQMKELCREECNRPMGLGVEVAGRAGAGSVGGSKVTKTIKITNFVLL
jgi:hypothetical protein